MVGIPRHFLKYPSTKWKSCVVQMALQIIKALFAILLIMACTPSPPPQGPPSSDRDEDDSKYRDSNRSRRYAERRTGECDGNKKCGDICDDIFISWNVREECKEFSISAVEDMEDVFKVLAEPDRYKRTIILKCQFF